jgi:hypothetical protein
MACCPVQQQRKQAASGVLSSGCRTSVDNCVVASTHPPTMPQPILTTCTAGWELLSCCSADSSRSSTSLLRAGTRRLLPGPCSATSCCLQHQPAQHGCQWSVLLRGNGQQVRTHSPVGKGCLHASLAKVRGQRVVYNRSCAVLQLHSPECSRNLGGEPHSIACLAFTSHLRVPVRSVILAAAEKK